VKLTVPVPATDPHEAVPAIFAVPLTVHAPVTARFPAELTVSVRPVASVILASVTAVEIVGSFVTPAAGMLTSFVDPGTAPVTQLPAVVQLVLAAPFHVAVFVTTCGLPVIDPELVFTLVSPLY
jgi:hypothetical protein